MECTSCTVAVEAQYQLQIQTIMGTDVTDENGNVTRVPNLGVFTAGFSETGQLPITHYVTSGAFYNEELDMIANDTSFPKLMWFGQGVRTPTLIQVPATPEIGPTAVDNVVEPVSPATPDPIV